LSARTLVRSACESPSTTISKATRHHHDYNHNNNDDNNNKKNKDNDNEGSMHDGCDGTVGLSAQCVRSVQSCHASSGRRCHNKCLKTILVFCALSFALSSQKDNHSLKIESETETETERWQRKQRLFIESRIITAFKNAPPWADSDALLFSRCFGKGTGRDRSEIATNPQTPILSIARAVACARVDPRMQMSERDRYTTGYL
jgi:hypothetical protein